MDILDPSYSNDSDYLCLIASLLTEIRDSLRQSSPIAAVPYEQLSGMMDAMTRGIPTPPARGVGIYKVQGPNGELPDPVGTPGATNPDVTDATLQQTIGTSGWTATVRPPVAYTNTVKLVVMGEYGLTGNPADFELDHLVPLCCGGNPTSQLNLWAQRRAGVNGAPLKDLTEVLAQHAILAGHLSLSDAQQGFMKNWYDLHVRLTSNPATMKLLMGLAPPEEEP
jgi:hypothetical protein